jgi:hypothetical protein
MMRKAIVIVILGLTCLFTVSKANQKQNLPGGTSVGIQSVKPALVKLDPDFGKMPLYFIANKGQLDERVAFYVQGKDKAIYFTEGGVTFVLGKAAPKKTPGRAEEMMPFGDEPRQAERHVVKLDFIGADPDVRPAGEDKTEAVISYFKGNQKDWRTGLPTYGRIVYRNLWPGIDLAYWGTTDSLKYEFIVHPGADPSLVRLACRGASNLKVTGSGELEVETPLGGFKDGTPSAYQEEKGERIDIDISYDLDGLEYGFRIGKYDRSKTLVLDPAILIYCGFVGGSGADVAFDIAVDNSGCAYITGYTASAQSKGFPVLAGPDVTYNGGAYDVFVAKVNAAGTALVYCGYIGGAGDDFAYGIALDGSSCAYISGYTHSTEAEGFPVLVGPDLSHNGSYDAFVAKVDATGTALVYCGYIGGINVELASGIAVTSTGTAYVVGYTNSNEASFPVHPGMNYNGGVYQGGLYDAFVAKVAASGALAYCRYVGGTGDDYGGGIALDSGNNPIIVGDTSSDQTSFPRTSGPVHQGLTDVFVAYIEVNSASLYYCRYIGGSSNDQGIGIAIDKSNNVYVTGDTGSSEAGGFPVKVGPGLAWKGGYDAFVAKLDFTLSSIAYCGYIGGAQADYGHDIAVDPAGNAYVVGYTASNATTDQFPAVGGPDLSFNGNNDAFVARVKSDGSGLVYCGYIGGSDVDHGYGIAVDTAGTAYVVGQTYSSEATFPETSGWASSGFMSNQGIGDAFVAEIQYVMTKNDFNGDGYGDILWRHYGTGKNAVWFLGNSGSGAPVAGFQGFGPKEQELSPEEAAAIQAMMNPGNPANVKDWNALSDLRKAADFRNGRRDKEIEYIDFDGRAGGRTLSGMGAGPASALASTFLGYAFLLPVTESYWYIVGTGDFNNDGKADILWQHDTTGTNIVWFMNGTTFSSYQYVLNAGDLNWKIAGTGDFNNDGKVDILWRHATSGANAVWFMNGATYSSYAYLPAADLNWKVVGTGDFNLDGKVDILWQHATTGANAVWYMNGATYMSYEFLLNAGDLNWKIVGTGDFNNDGKVDILWRHASTGANIVWYMNGAAYSSYQYLPSEPDVNWHIVNH